MLTCELLNNIVNTYILGILNNSQTVVKYCELSLITQNTQDMDGQKKKGLFSWRS